jgi:hypothetical protein
MKNSGLGSVGHSQFDKGKEQAQRLAKANLTLIKENKMNFDIKDHSYIKLVKNLYNQKYQYTDKQLSLIDSLMEKYWKLGGFGSIGVKHDHQKQVRY